MTKVFFFILPVLAGAFGTPLDDYICKPDHTYNYEVTGTVRGVHFTQYFLNMTSQTWKQIMQSRPIWWHEMIITIPDKMDSDSALMLISGGSNSKRYRVPRLMDKFSDLMTWIATSTNTVTAEIKQVPNQPISFEDDPSHYQRTEDAIVAWTWKSFIDSNGTDPEILLRLPMTKAAVRGIDTVQHLVAKAANRTINRFVLTGASKRGWATWTTAAVDTRVVAFVPVVMDLLNLVKNLHHYYRSLGGWTYEFLPYYLTDFTARIDHPATQMMADIIDPIAYIGRYIFKPKLIIGAGGDEFFMIDDTKFYFRQLLGDKYLRMIPNTDHGLKHNINNVFEGIRAFYLSVIRRLALPELKWKAVPTKDGGRITLWTNIAPQTVSVYHASTISSKRKDFRMYILTPKHPFHPVFNPVKWLSQNATYLGNSTYAAEINKPRKGWTAFFIEATFQGVANSTHTYTTETLIVPDTYPFSDCRGESCRGHLV